MQKIFNISLPRTGTQSIHKFLQSAGYNSMHWIGNYVDIESMVPPRATIDDLFNLMSNFDDKFDAFNDTPYNILHEHYAKKYPNAKFILVTRRFEDWLESKSSFNKKVIEKMTPLQKLFYSGYGSNNIDDLNFSYQVSVDQYKNIYDNHIERCLSFFSNNNNFIHVGLNDNSISSKLSNFFNLNHEIQLSNIDFLKRIG